MGGGEGRAAGGARDGAAQTGAGNEMKMQYINPCLCGRENAKSNRLEGEKREQSSSDEGREPTRASQNVHRGADLPQNVHSPGSWDSQTVRQEPFPCVTNSLQSQRSKHTQ